MNEYYVYMYRNPITLVPFYVGKGKGGRSMHHINEARKEFSTDKNLHKLHTIRKLFSAGTQPIVEVVESEISEEESFEFEKFLISEIGRSDLGTGPLTNMSDGGEGLSGLVRDLSGGNNPNYGKRGESAVWWGRNHEEETKQKISAAQKGRVFSDEHKAKMRKPKSEEGRKNIADAQRILRESGYKPSAESNKRRSESLRGRPSPMKGKTQSDSARQKMSDARKGKPKNKKQCIYCGATCAPNMLHRWHMENCKEKK